MPITNIIMYIEASLHNHVDLPIIDKLLKMSALVDVSLDIVAVCRIIVIGVV